MAEVPVDRLHAKHAVAEGMRAYEEYRSVYKGR
jgi:hypothetical protein